MEDKIYYIRLEVLNRINFRKCQNIAFKIAKISKIAVDKFTMLR